MDKYHQTQQLLERLESVMREAGIWETKSPASAALASVEPFAVDTLTCSQWFQWIFIPRMTQLVVMQAPLPTQFEISPYAEEAMKDQPGFAVVLGVTREFDDLFRAK
ncbi:YqcC family protein [uncultured Photobacterium sp.]|uniref:YqcC family protein n=1 Tax=uncultured Photobacterium sp. TaxID=173973 RepID=UPI0026030001|nr:YqcC family protein [uncultured Photobacterium sp.]